MHILHAHMDARSVEWRLLCHNMSKTAKLSLSIYAACTHAYLFMKLLP